MTDLQDLTDAVERIAAAVSALGEWAVARRCLAQALAWARLCGAADASIELLCELAETALDASDDEGEDTPHARRFRDQARDHAFEASRLAAHCADPQWEVTVLLRVSEALVRCGDHDDAIALQCRALQLIAHHAAVDALELDAAANGS